MGFGRSDQTGLCSPPFVLIEHVTSIIIGEQSEPPVCSCHLRFAICMYAPCSDKFVKHVAHNLQA